VLLAAAPAAAESQLKPFVGLTLGGSTTFVDTDRVAGNTKFNFGVSGTLLGEVVGVEADVGHLPGFFTAGNTVPTSGVTTLTANVIVAMPRRLARYTLRPYVAGGAGVMHVHIEFAPVGALPIVSSTLGVVDVGGGVTGFLTNHVGVSWDVRRFGSVGGTDRMQGVSFGAEQLSFWRATMAIAIRFQ